MNPKIVVGGISTAVVAIAVPLYVSSEGMVLKSYQDPIGIWTRCAGHTGPEVKPGQVMTEQQCMADLVRDFEAHYAGIKACVPSVAEAPPQVQAAVLDFTMNVGVEKFCGSTMAAKLRAADHQGVCNEFPRWVMVGSMDCRKPEFAKRCGGIVKRRQLEKATCEGKAPQPVSLGVTG